jgi:hypothetical protein
MFRIPLVPETNMSCKVSTPWHALEYSRHVRQGDLKATDQQIIITSWYGNYISTWHITHMHAQQSRVHAAYDVVQALTLKATRSAGTKPLPTHTEGCPSRTAAAAASSCC